MAKVSFLPWKFVSNGHLRQNSLAIANATAWSAALLSGIAGKILRAFLEFFRKFLRKVPAVLGGMAYAWEKNLNEPEKYIGKKVVERHPWSDGILVMDEVPWNGYARRVAEGLRGEGEIRLAIVSWQGCTFIEHAERGAKGS